MKDKELKLVDEAKRKVLENTKNKSWWEGYEAGRQEVIGNVDQMIKNLETRTTHPLKEIIPSMKKEGLKVAMPDGGWVKWFDIEKDWMALKKKVKTNG